MFITINELHTAGTRAKAVKEWSLTEARKEGLQTVFLCHSHLDGPLVKGLVTLLGEHGWQVYVDWRDESMPEIPNHQTASRIKHRIVDLTFFLFLATANSMSSRWCPWEIGYADGEKRIDRILILPTKDGYKTHGNEYLQLYRRIELSDMGRLAVYQPGQKTNGILVKNL